VIAAPEVETALREAAAAHRHPCPRQVLGVRMGVYAGEVLGLPVPQSDKRLYTLVETDGCFVDGITAATGCSLGHRTLRLMDEGKVAATFVDTKSGHAVRMSPHAESRTRALEYVPDAPTRWHAQLEAYQMMPAGELLCVRAVKLAIDLKALIGAPGVRVNCGHCGEEILNRREVLRNGEVLCTGCARGSYVRQPAI
jgi:formylmethanofuran dehydrogenase subunit E